MPKFDLYTKKKGLTIREALEILDGKDKRKLTPSQQAEIKKVSEQLKKTAYIVTKAAKKTLQNFKLPTYKVPEVYSPIDYSFLNYEIEGRVEDYSGKV